jgi:transposase
MPAKREPTSEIIDTLVEARGQGLSIRASCKRAGISVSTWYAWVREAEYLAGLRKLAEFGMFDPENEAAILAALEPCEREAAA